MPLSPIRRAALVVANLDTNAADEILDRMSPEQAAAIRDEILGLSDADLAEQSGVLREFLHPPVQLEVPPRDGKTKACGTTSSAVPRPEAHELPSPSFRDLLELDDEVIATSLAYERATVVAAMLAAMPSARAASVLRLLQDALQMRVLQLLGRGVTPQPQVMDEVAEYVCDRHVESSGRAFPGLRHEQALQSILLAMSPPERRDMLRSLAIDNPLLARRLAENSELPDDCSC